MLPASRITVAPMPGPVSAAESRERRLTPITSWVALTERANSASAVGTSSPVAAAEFVEQRPLPGELGRIGRAQSVLIVDVHGEEFPACGPRGDPGAPPQERLAFRAARERHDDPLAGLPLAVDAVLSEVALQRLIYFIGQPEERELPECREVAEPEVVRAGRIDPLRRVDVSAGEPVAQRLRVEVDDLDPIGAAEDLIGHGLALRDAGDLLDDVVERFDVLDVDGRDDVDAGVQDLLHVLPALPVPGPRRVGMGELVHERDIRMPGQHGVQIHVREFDAAVRHRASGHGLEPGRHGRRRGTAVGLHERDHHILAFAEEPFALLEHGVGLADAGRGTEEHRQSPPCRRHVTPPGRPGPG